MYRHINLVKGCKSNLVLCDVDCILYDARLENRANKLSMSELGVGIFQDILN